MVPIHLLHQIGHENLNVTINVKINISRAFRLCMGQKRERSPLPLSLRYPEKFRDLEPRFQTPHKQQQSRTTPYQHVSVFLCSSRRLTQ